MAMVIHCPCGTAIRSDDEQELVARAQAHARDEHGLQLTVEQARAMAEPE